MEKPVGYMVISEYCYQRHNHKIDEWYHRPCDACPYCKKCLIWCDGSNNWEVVVKVPVITQHHLDTDSVHGV